MIDLLYEKTEDEIELQGTYFDSKKKDICVLFVHGQAQSILNNSFAYKLGKYLSSRGISFLYGHNRGHNYINCLHKGDGSLLIEGATFEIFEDSLKDIDVWMSKIKEYGYKKIILMGHSLGCNKVLYYLNKREMVDGLIFASAPDMVGITKKEESNFLEIFKEAKEAVESGESRKILSGLLGETDYISAGTFLSESLEESNIDNFPIERNPVVFEQLSKINIPILSFAGTLEYPTYLRQDVLKEKAINSEDFTYKVIDGANHFYYGCEDELNELLYNWIKKFMN